MNNFFTSSTSSPFFSIIIPTYNSEATLSRCLDSILAQNFTDFELLIMDGL
ncbi:MAG: glycosyltransferase, partial [Prevotellaceae bacterium]|nr:glycosyltransferase [Prevotellaceae bacterium]